MAVDALLERDLVYVTGKGGSGKTTVAAALGIAGAALGRRTLGCEVDGADRLTGAFEEGTGVTQLSIDAREALREWMRAQPGGAIAAATLGRSRAFARFVDAAPGAKELVTIGKAADLARDSYDLVIVDGPSTGHALGMLAAPRTVGRVAPVGPIGDQARVLHGFLADRSHVGYVGVSLPEEMSLHELLELEAGLHEAVGRGLDLIVVDAVYPDRFTDADAQRLEELASGSSPIRAALGEHRVARLHAERVRELRRRAAAPVVTLPFVFESELGPADYGRLARRLSGGDAARSTCLRSGSGSTRAARPSVRGSARVLGDRSPR